MARRYPHKITVQQPLKTADAAGQLTTSWQTVLRRWAMVQELGGGERQSQDQTQQRQPYRVELRADTNAALIHSACRILWTPPHGSELTLQITAVNGQGTGRGRVLTWLAALDGVRTIDALTPEAYALSTLSADDLSTLTADSLSTMVA